MAQTEQIQFSFSVFPSLLYLLYELTLSQCIMICWPIILPFIFPHEFALGLDTLQHGTSTSVSVLDAGATSSFGCCVFINFPQEPCEVSTSIVPPSQIRLRLTSESDKVRKLFNTLQPYEVMNSLFLLLRTCVSLLLGFYFLLFLIPHLSYMLIPHT